MVCSARTSFAVIWTGDVCWAFLALVKELRSFGSEAEFINADVRKEDDVRVLVDKMSTPVIHGACHTSWPHCSAAPGGGRDACGARARSRFGQLFARTAFPFDPRGGTVDINGRKGRARKSTIASQSSEGKNTAVAGRAHSRLQ
jgi:hypothetical protein